MYCRSDDLYVVTSIDVTRQSKIQWLLDRLHFTFDFTDERKNFLLSNGTKSMCWSVPNISESLDSFNLTSSLLDILF